jgi:hypothetical protein
MIKMVPHNRIGTSDEALQKEGRYDNCSGNCTCPVPPMVKAAVSEGITGVMHPYRETPGPLHRALRI